MRLILIRHGQTPSNVLGLLDTALPGPGLTDLGLEQAAGVVEALADEPTDRIVASAATRAQLTAQPLAQARGMAVDVIDGLHEIAAGSWEMSGEHEAVRGYIDRLATWMGGQPDEPTPGPTGESGSQVLARVDRGVEQAFADGAETVALVSHGAVIRLWASIRATNLPNDYGAEHSVSNTGMVVLQRNGSDQWQAESWVGEPIGGDELDDFAHDGPAADPQEWDLATHPDGPPSGMSSTDFRIADPTGG